MANGPKSLPELFAFYHDFVKPLYSAVQLQDALPIEVLFEINAAFDHLSRHWQYSESEAEVTTKAYSHLKRSCLDIFKLAVKQAGQQFAELRKIDTSVLDNGEFDRKLVALWTTIKEGAKAARQNEGNIRDDDAAAIRAFDLWSPVYAHCVTLEKEFYAHRGLSWAQKRQGRGKWVERLLGFILGVIASIVAAFLYDAYQRNTSSPPPSVPAATMPTAPPTSSVAPVRSLHQH